METNKVKISSIVESQLPLFVREEYPLVSELLTEYYRSLESKGSSYDILQNIDQYVKVNNLTNLVEKTTTTANISFSSSVIEVDNTDGFPQTYGILQINNEIILYKSKTQTSFNDCVRGFSGITEYSVGNSEDLVFTSTEIQEHSNGSEVLNLGALFLKEFFGKVKKQLAYGFDNRELYSGVNQNLFLKQSKDFYTSKGSNRSFEILFRVLYGKDVEVILPRDYLIEPSNAQYRVTRNFVVEPIQGNAEELLNKTVFQNQYGDLPKSFGTVADIQKSIQNGKEYYTLMLDYDFNKDIIVSGSIFGELKIHPKTMILEDVQISSDNIVVDSTIGFPESGELIVQNQDTSLIVNYNGKTINQFLNCSNIDQLIASGSFISLNTYAYGYDSQGNEIQFRITGVIEDVELPENSKYYEKGDVAKLLTLGYNKDYLKDNNWVFNTTVKCEVKSFTSDGEFKYTIETYDDNGIYEGDGVEIEYINSSTGVREISVINGANVRIANGSIPGKIFQIQTNGFNISSIFYVKRIISKFSNRFASNVLNVYRDFNSDDVYTVCHSLPSYGSDVNENVEDFKVTLNGSFSGETLKIVNNGQNHGFVTGDSVLYLPENESSSSNRLDIQSGIYFVKRESSTEIKLARSRSDIKFERFVSVGATTLINSTNTISLSKFAKKNSIPSEIDSQNLVKVLKSPENDGKKYKTVTGTTGILINGVEILNYKSDDFIYYGPIKSVDVISSGNNYDIINPPELQILSASVGLSSASGYCGVEGSLQKIDVIDGGTDYIETPIITITGGGGEGATAIAKMTDYEHFVDFNSSSSNTRFNIVGLAGTDILGFSTYHKFRDNESVVYLPGENTIVGGLTTEAKYYVKVVDGYRIKLYETSIDSIADTNAINFTSYGSGNHTFKSTTIKKKVGSIIVTNQGSGYKSKKISVVSSGINTSTDSVEAYKNPYNSGDIIYYYGGSQNISGLNTGRYIVTKVGEDSFKLSNIGIGSTSQDFFYKTKQYINFKSSGSGYHVFDYEPISVTISGKVGIPTTFGVNADAIVQPVFRGKVVSTFIYDGGVGYGSSEIINYNKQPEYNLKSGNSATLQPIVSNGKIIDVVISQKGSEYNSPPDLVIKGVGIGASVVPIIQNGKIVEVKIVSGGIGYEQKSTTIEVLSAGSGCKLNFNPQIWTINKFQRLLETSKLPVNDSVVFVGNDKEYGLQYTHLYAPRPLRKKIFSKTIEDGKAIYRSDYQNDFESKKYHSPLLGWAYDGNPIYGPYGYDSATNKTVRLIQSGYSNPVDNQTSRPNKNTFPAGYFVEDYEFNNSGDLDEHNGRFCVTPEFPNGTYAYFMTLESATATSGFFSGNKKPRFPYIIGNSFKSKPIDFNFNKINQDTFDFTKDGIVRNTKPYNTLSNTSTYEYFAAITDPELQNLKVDNTNRGPIDSVQIISGGENYKVGDRIIFNNENSGGFSAAAKVDYIKGKSVTGIAQSTIKISDVEFYPSDGTNTIIGFSTVPHGLSNRDLVFIDSLSNYDEFLQKSFNIEVKPNNFVLTLDVDDASVTGLTTYFYVSGLLNYPTIRENDILSINSEKIKVLNIDKDSSRIRVLREQDSTVSTAHSAFISTLQENPRKFSITLQNRAKNQNYKLNRELYFDPSESLGIGTYVGFGNTVTFSNPGVGITSLVIPEKSIFLKDHGLNTGDQIKYKRNNGTSISVSTDGVVSFSLNTVSDLYVAKISNDLIGISTVKVGLGTTGSFVGISQTASTLFFTGIGTGDHHSFQTKFDNLSKGNVVRNRVTVSTASTHSLQRGDSINLNVLSGLTTTIFVKYDDYNRRLIVNPRNFSSIDIENNLITITNHKYSDGQKLVHTSSSPASGLEDKAIYYAIIYDNDRIRLATSHYNSINQNSINIQTSSFGTLSEVNPKISVIKNQKVVVDLSDSSLSQPFGLGRTTSFDFEFYIDQNFSSKYFPIDANGISKILKFGDIGISPSARIEFTVDEDFPNEIWYNLVPKLDVNLIESKEQYNVDYEVTENNKISFIGNVLNGKKMIVGVQSSTFTFNNEYNYESNTYTQGQSNISYITNSINEVGEIESIKVTSGGMRYERLPSISTVSSSTGSGAILLPKSEGIGKINSMNIVDIGYNYSVDSTIKPSIKYPTIMRVIPLSRLKSIDVISPGLNYNTTPDLILIDGFTNQIVDDVILNYDMPSFKVDIVNNTTGIYNVTPKIIAINNSNGLGISSVQYESSNKTVKAYLTKQFSNPNDFPFSVGENVLIEGISVLEANKKGYNSKNYNYSLFPVVGVNTSTGGSNAYVEYSLEGLLLESTPGTFDVSNSLGQIIPERFLPTFKIILSKNSFIVGEKVTVGTNGQGKVSKFDEKNEFLTVETKDEFFIDSLVVGNTSKSQAFVKEIFETEDFCKIGSSSIVKNGWKRETGFLNNDLQRVQDSDYYQKFSYSLKSEIPIQEWNDVVSNLNHTLGFKKFSDLTVNSSSEISGIQTSQNAGSFSAICDLNSTVDVDCIQDYDLVSENSLYVNNTLTSNEIIFNSSLLQDYSESTGNKVLIIDDISGEFDKSETRTFVTSFNI